MTKNWKPPETPKEALEAILQMQRLRSALRDEPMDVEGEIAQRALERMGETSDKQIYRCYGDIHVQKDPMGGCTIKFEKFDVSLYSHQFDLLKESLDAL